MRNGRAEREYALFSLPVDAQLKVLKEPLLSGTACTPWRFALTQTKPGCLLRCQESPNPSVLTFLRSCCTLETNTEAEPIQQTGSILKDNISYYDINCPLIFIVRRDGYCETKPLSLVLSALLFAHSTTLIRFEFQQPTRTSGL